MLSTDSQVAKRAQQIIKHPMHTMHGEHHH